LYAFIPQELLTGNIKNQFEEIENFIKDNPKEAARVFLRTAKSNAALKAEFSVFKKLFESKPILQIKKHPVHKVVMNLLHVFFQDFTDKGVHVEVGETTQMLNLDYESIQVALYHIMDNAVKYCLINTPLIIEFLKLEGNFVIRFDMISVQIESDEIERIFEEHYRGMSARELRKPGSGIGLNVVKRILSLNNAKLVVQPDSGGRNGKYFSGVKYQNNIFDIIFHDQG
jgi:K+-sensing histidine kinase KdpD